MSLFTVGASVEYKYKDKDWKNGEIISSNKQEISIKILKKINKYKTIKIPKSKAMTLLYIKKTLKLSNVIYPTWKIMLNKMLDIN